ncbi:MAG: hypothetical protein OXH61_08805 [Acidimicrobiaceae bacterium]|nr:hypothetical protein [Acidimicrobiaceae bacterium]
MGHYETEEDRSTSPTHRGGALDLTQYFLTRDTARLFDPVRNDLGVAPESVRQGRWHEERETIRFATRPHRSPPAN